MARTPGVSSRYLRGAGTRQVTGALPQNAMYPPNHNQKDPTMVWFSYKSSTTKLWTKTVGRALP